MMGGYGIMGGMGWLGMVMMALLWIGVLLLIVWGLSSMFPRGRFLSNRTRWRS